ncbi:GyrI-like domain-containing protein [Motilibacter deserti]|uniref:GyrI-like domain-containing protein n=1 Tax=Motilibacter deserti TaxID=2714956 RepID=A0ABX0GWX4_9ACTN|nr:GyrI-like domain-containing protein [Motilibacter deserti]NHC15446.1 GyrI-like domain-containing protein [Motilibacter deserti]
MQILQRRPTVVAGLPVTAKFDQLAKEVPEAWARLFARRADLPSPQRGYVELSAYVGDGVYAETLGVEVLPETRLRGEWALALLPAGDYVHHVFRGAVPDIGTAFGEMHDWAEGQGRTIGSRKLDVGYLPDGRDGQHELWVELLD